MPPKNKRSSANTHDRRHESGLASQAGKKPNKIKTNGFVNGHVDTNKPPAGSDIPPPLDHLDRAAPLQHPSNHDRSNGAAEATHSGILPRRSDYSKEEEDVSGYSDALYGDYHDQNRSDGCPSDEQKDDGATRKQGSSPIVSYPRTTVVGPRSLQDAVAILLLLLHLPSTALTFVQFCFAYLTFGSLSSGFSLSALTSSPDWLQSQGGHPSIATMVMVDFLVLAVWFVLPLGKNFTLDLAQCAIAITLGGGVVGRGASTNCIVCASIVAISHAAGFTTMRHYTASLFSPLISRAGPWSSKFTDAFLSTPSKEISPRNWPRIILEVHIITQAIIRIVRRWINRRVEPSAALAKKVDPETTGASVSSALPISNDVSIEGVRNTSSDGRPPGPSPAGLAGEKFISSGKKRRKQATHVRLQQPFWAAIANSKVTRSKDLQQNQASVDRDDAESSNAHHPRIESTGLQDRVWVTGIYEDGVQFHAVLHKSRKENDKAEEALSDGGGSSALDHFGDLYVRLNGTQWSAISMRSDGFLEGVKTIEGRITGLTPATNFLAEFVRTCDEQVIFSTMLFIRPVANPEKAVSSQPPRNLRPSSPTSTLKQSIITAETQLTELRNNSRKLRKDNRNATSSLNREVSNLESRLSSFGTADERQRQRRIQFSQNIKQLEDSALSIASEIQTLGDIPEDEQETFAEKRQLWQSKKDELAQLKQRLQENKAEDERQVNATRSTKDHFQQKRERLAGKLSKLEQNEKDLIAANSLSQQERYRRDTQRAHIVGQWEAAEHDLIGRIQYFENARMEAEARAAQYGHQSAFAESSFNPQYPVSNSVPQTPEHTFAGLAAQGSRAPAAPSSFSNTQYNVGTTSTPMHSRRGSTQQKFRPRSSSMLSDVSGFTNDEVVVPPPIGLPHSSSIDSGHIEGAESRKRSTGSGSGSIHRPASGSGRQSDSPSKLSPIGGRGSPWNPKLL